MTFHFESNLGEGEDKKKDSEYRKNYGQGYTARLKGEKIETIPFKDLESPETKAWYEGYNDARTKKEQEEIKKLEELYEIKNE